MSESNRVVITGELLDGVERAQAVTDLAAKFKITEVKADAMLAKAPVTIKKGLDETKAKKYVQLLKGVGVIARVESMESVLMDSVENNAEQTAPAQTVKSKDTATKPPANAEGFAKDPNLDLPEMPGLQFRYYGKPDFGYLVVDIPANTTMKVEASAMATMDTNIRMKTKMKGGLGRFVSGESLFINEFTAENGPGEIGIAPGTPGDITHQYLDGNTIFLQNSAFVACAMDVEVETKWQGLTKGFFSGESFFLIRCSGKGDLFFNTYGGLVEIDVDGEYVVDTGNIVAFSEGLDYNITKVGGYKSLFFSGEGFVCRFTGKGKVWMQTRGTDAFVGWCQPFRKVDSK